jgi:dTDP-4-dehydrorhamnose 3,5-epimerase
MIFTPTSLPGAFVIEPEKFSDARGFYARLWDQKEFASHGLNPRLVQSDVSFNHKSGTLRGMHFQSAPNAQAKLVRCTAGAIHDVIIDLRPDSPTFTRHVGVELTAANHRLLYVPEGFAHGYLTLKDNTEVAYQMSEHYAPASGGGVRWNDPAFAIAWPGPVNVVLPRDNFYPDFSR